MNIAIVGYGNLGRGVEAAVMKTLDMHLVAVFTRRDPQTLKISTPGVPIYHLDDAVKYKNDIDVMVICGGSATDLPVITPELAKDFNVVDSFDNHTNIPVHFARVDEAARSGGHAAIISVGWDPGLFSVSRLYMSSVLPDGRDYTFWGRGVSQGHSDAIRRIDGVLDARQYTVPVPGALDSVRSGNNPDLTTRQKHTRECYVVASDGADLAAIEQRIKTMPSYFADYDTTVTFISMDEMRKNHAALPHGGSVFRTGETSDGVKHKIEFNLTLDSNPEFTASVLCAFARAASRLSAAEDFGCKTIFDISPALLSPLSADDLRARML